MGEWNKASAREASLPDQFSSPVRSNQKCVCKIAKRVLPTVASMRQGTRRRPFYEEESLGSPGDSSSASFMLSGGSTSRRSWQNFSRRARLGMRSPRSSHPRNRLDTKGLLSGWSPNSSIQHFCGCRTHGEPLMSFGVPAEEVVREPS